LYEIYKNFYDFVSAIPLNNGHYQDAAATVSNPNLRVVGQKDLVHQRAHLWIQNRRHTWRNVVDGVSIPPLSGTVALSGFEGGNDYTLEWWDTYATPGVPRVIRKEKTTARSNGDIVLILEGIAKDAALSVSRPGPTGAPIHLPVIIKDSQTSHRRDQIEGIVVLNIITKIA
jgi:hypothetical protein